MGFVHGAGGGYTEQRTGAVKRPGQDPTIVIVQGGGGGGYRVNRNEIEELFIYWFGAGAYTKSMVDRAVNEQWTADEVRRTAVKYQARGEGMRMALNEVRQALSRNGIAWEGYDDPTVYSLISSGLFAQGGFEDYLTTLAGFDWTKASNSAQFMALWTEMTGEPITEDAMASVQDAVKQYGWDGAYDWFQQWLPTTESAINGNYGDAKRLQIGDMIRQILHREPTEEELLAPGQTLEEMEGEAGALWNLNEAGLLEYMRGTDEYQQMYAAKPSWMSESAFNAQRQAYDTLYRQLYVIDATEVDENGDPVYPDGPPGMPDDLLGYYLANGISVDEIAKETEWMNNVEEMHETVVPVVEEVFGRTLTDDELKAITSGAKGSGALRALVIQAQNQIEFREVFKLYNDRDPEPEDYEYLNSHYVSPNEYSRVTGALVDAESKLPEINEVMQRVMGQEYTLEDIQDMILGREGTGAMQAMIAQAIKLDSYTDAFYQHYGRVPTPDEYASFADYPSAAQLQRDLQVDEQIAEYKPEIQEVFSQYMGRELSDDEMEMLFREGEGSGALKAQWKQAQELEAKDKAKQSGASRGNYVNVGMAGAQGGGISLANKPKGML